MEEFYFPKDFLMGTATAGLQIEGGDRNNNWYRWCEEGHIKDGSHCIRAVDHWNRYKEDIDIISKLNNHVYRLGLEWSRIEPIRGEFNKEGIEHYRNEITLLIEKGIKPLVTLHHFSNPLWFEEIGAWENIHSVSLFERYVSYVVESLGDLVCEWITINEPNVYLYEGYVEGSWPPGKKNIISLVKAMKNMTLGHIKAYSAIHNTRHTRGYKGKTLVGVANHIRVFDPEKDSFMDKRAAKKMDYLFHDILIEGMTKGKFNFPMGSGNYPLGEGKYYDFIGINYYSRGIVSFSLNPFTFFTKEKTKGNSNKNDLGWELYAEGLYRVCKIYYEKYNGPIFITENGICDSKDEKRAKFIYDHLKVIWKLIKEGVPVERYYHWSLMDNFEWIEGEKARFGLVHIDYETQKRTIRKSGLFYGEICKEKAVTAEMINKYIK